MHTSRFQLGLIATLAMGLGFSLSSSEAIGYPAGPVVSTGSNPVVSVGGGLARGSSAIVMEAGDQDVVITDMAIDHYVSDPTCLASTTLTFSLESTGEVLAKRVVSMNWWSNAYSGQGNNLDTSMHSGVRIPTGEQLRLSTERILNDSCSTTANQIVYTLSGYHAHP